MAQERVALRRRHSAELRALVLAQCAAPRASVAKVAMSHGLSANMVHGWRQQAREQHGAGVAPTAKPKSVNANAFAELPHFVPLSLPHTSAQPMPADIQIELRRGATAVKITWPIAAAGECAAWMRELLG